MARKKIEEVVEEVAVTEVATETTVEEKPKAKRTSKKTTAKKADEEPKVEEPKIEVPEAEIKAEPEPVADIKPVKEVKVEFPYKAVISAKSGLNVLVGPALSYNKIGNLKVGTKIVVLEEKGNFGRIGMNRWININYIEKI